VSIVAAIALFAIARGAAADSTPVNIARGRPYTLTPAPNYALTTDADDSRQLTDGSYTSGTLWTRTSTVGWNWVSHVTIVIDLQSVQAVGGLSYSTAAGSSEVMWPRSIFALVSDDGVQFYPVGDLATLEPGTSGPPASGYATYRYTRGSLGVHGRYVALVVEGDGAYTFCDEIEVWSGDAATVGVPLTGTATTDLQRYFFEAHERTALVRRLTMDVAAARAALASTTLDDVQRAQLTIELDALSAAIPAASTQARTPSAVLPLNDVHTRIFAVQGAVAAAHGLSPLAMWAIGPWDFATPLDKAPPTGGLDGVSLAAMSGEVRSGAIAIANATARPMRVGLRVTGLPFEASSAELRLFEAVWTDTRELTPVADALLPIADTAPWIDVPAGMTRHIWIRVSPRNRASGHLRGFVEASTDDNLSAHVPIDIRIVDGRFPDRPTLHTGGWDYTNAPTSLGLTPDNVAPLVSQLRDVGVDMPWATSLVMPAGAFDTAGRLTTAPDTAAFDSWIRRWPDATRYAVFVCVQDRIGTVSSVEGARFTTAVGQWMSYWVAHAKAIGIDAAQLVLLLVDEPHSDAQDARIVAWASAIRAAEPRVVIFEDPTYRDPATSRPALVDVSDVLALKRSLLIEQGTAFAAYYRDRHSRGQALAVYGASGPARLLDPYTYYRLQPWVCADLGATSSLFWSFADDAAGHSWNEYATTDAPYSPFFLSTQAVAVSKHSEAMREGVEDYEYLTMLAARMAAMAQIEPTHAGMPESLAMLASAVPTVLQTPGAADLKWVSNKDRSAAERVRLAIADLLERLNAKTIVATATTATIGDGAIVFGQPVTLTARVTGATATSGEPTGHVRFETVGAALGDVVLVNGSAALTVTSLRGGPQAIDVSYAGDDTHLPSRVQVVLIVQPAAPRLTVSDLRVTYDGRSHAVVATVTGLDGGAVNGSLAFTYAPGGTSPPINAGAYALTVDFTSADVSYAGASGRASVTIDPAQPVVTVASATFVEDGAAHTVTPIAVGVDSVAVAGSFSIVYSPGDGSAPILARTYSATALFTSADTNYTNAAGTGSLVINPPVVVDPPLDPAAAMLTLTAQDPERDWVRRKPQRGHRARVRQGS